jgi:hypothetical protein
MFGSKYTKLLEDLELNGSFLSIADIINYNIKTIEDNEEECDIINLSEVKRRKVDEVLNQKSVNSDGIISAEAL